MLITPATGASFHVRECFNIQWSSVVGAHYYLLEVGDDEPTFSYPLTPTTCADNLRHSIRRTWGNPLNVYYESGAVSVDNVRSLPSTTRTIHVTNIAPVPAGVSPVAPAVAATVQLPFFLDWSDTANPQVPGYDLDFDTGPNFALATMVLFLSPSRSDYMITRDLLAPGSYFWRVRALHGDVPGPWSAGRSITVRLRSATPASICSRSSQNPSTGTAATEPRESDVESSGACWRLACFPRDRHPTGGRAATTVTVPAGRTDAPLSGSPPARCRTSGGGSIGIIGVSLLGSLMVANKVR